jgi:CelD/BcsL family acetyltransferase involved in cellulose biosynthesis
MSVRGLRASPIVKIVDDWRSFEDIAPAWDDLAFSLDGGPFASHDGLCAWWQAFGRRLRPFIVTVWRDGALVGAAPLCIAWTAVSPRLPFLKVNRLQLIANERVGFNQWLVAPGHEDVIPILLGVIRDRSNLWDVAVLEPFAQSRVLDGIVETASDLCLPHTIETRFHSTVIDLSHGWSKYLASRSRSFRKNIRNALQRVGASKHRILRETDGGFSILERMLALSVQSWKGRAGTAFGSDAASASYVRQLWERLGGNGEMSLYLLEMDGVAVASHASLRHKNAAYGLFADFDERYARWSPGRFMLSYVLQDCASSGLDRYDMLRRTHFLEGFSDDYYEIRRLRLFPRKSHAYWITMAEVGLRPFADKAWNVIRGTKALRRDIKARG